jgi:hypothetical protein
MRLKLLSVSQAGGRQDYVEQDPSSDATLTNLATPLQ